MACISSDERIRSIGPHSLRQLVFLDYEGATEFIPTLDVTWGALDALASDHLLYIRTESGDKFGARYCTLSGEAYEAVDSNFAASELWVEHTTLDFGI